MLGACGLRYALGSPREAKDRIPTETVLFFDMHGTLIDRDYASYLSYQQAVREVTHGMLDIQFDPSRGFNRAELKKAFPQLSDIDINKISNLKSECYRRYLTETKLNSVLADILRIFKKTNKTVLVTNCQKERVAMTLQYHGLTEYFSYVFCRSDPPKGELKNKYIDALVRMEARPESVLAFENETAEMEKAILAGIPRENIINVMTWRREDHE